MYAHTLTVLRIYVRVQIRMRTCITRTYSHIYQQILGQVVPENSQDNAIEVKTLWLHVSPCMLDITRVCPSLFLFFVTRVCLSLSLLLSVYVYMYMYECVYVCVYIHIMPLCS